MAAPSSFVANAADPKQVRRGRSRERVAREEQLHALRSVLATPEGRYCLWHLLGQSKVMASVFARDPAQTAYNAGRQDFGHFLIAEIGEASPKAWLLMQQEAQVRAKLAEPSAEDAPPTPDSEEDDG